MSIHFMQFVHSMYKNDTPGCPYLTHKIFDTHPRIDVIKSDDIMLEHKSGDKVQ